MWHSCTDGHGAALLEHLRVKCVVKGHLHTKLSEQISPCWFSAANLLVRRSLLPTAAPSLLPLSDLDHVWAPWCITFKLKHRGSARLHHRHSPEMNIAWWRPRSDTYHLNAAAAEGFQKGGKIMSLFRSSWNGNCSDEETRKKERWHYIYERECG